MERVRELASKRAAVVIFTKSSCCMCHSIKSLFYELGASPAIHELDKDPYGPDMERALFLHAFAASRSSNQQQQQEQEQEAAVVVPAVFVGGKYVGSAKHVISLHLDGSLKQMLKDSKAIWL